MFFREIEERVKSRSPEVRRVKSSEKIKTENEPLVKVKTEGRPVKTEERPSVKSPESKSVFSRLGASEQVKQGVSRYITAEYKDEPMMTRVTQPLNCFRAVGVKVETEEVVMKQEVRGVFGRLGKQEEVKEEGEGRRKEQEARVTSTSEEKTHEELRSARASASPGRGYFC